MPDERAVPPPFSRAFWRLLGPARAMELQGYLRLYAAFVRELGEEATWACAREVLARSANVPEPRTPSPLRPRASSSQARKKRRRVRSAGGQSTRQWRRSRVRSTPRGRGHWY